MGGRVSPNYSSCSLWHLPPPEIDQLFCTYFPDPNEGTD